MRIVLVGATGLVGNVMISLLEEASFPITDFIPVASEKSVGKKIRFRSNDYQIV